MRESGLRERNIDWRQTGFLIRNSLRMDFRGRRPGKSIRSSPLVMTLVFYVVMGLSMSISLVLSASPFFFCLMILSYSMGMTVLAVMLEFGSNIIHPDDADILAFRPLTSRTYFLARIGHLLVFIAMKGSALTLLPSWIGLGLKEVGWAFPLIFFATALLANLAAAAFVVLIYTLLLRLLPYSVFKDILTAFQVVYSFVVFFGYQLIPRLSQDTIHMGSEGAAPWLLVWPPAWFAGAVQWIQGLDRPGYLRYTLLAAGSTLFISLIAFRKISLEYASTVSNLQARSGKEKRSSQTACVWKKREWAGIFLRNPETRAGYGVTSLMLKKDRTLKTGVYPLLGMPLAFMALAILDREPINPFSENAAASMGNMSVLMLFCILYILTMAMLYSTDWEAAWIFRVAPLRSPARLFRGVKMAVFVRLLLPLYLLLGLVYSFRIPALHAWLYTASLFVLGLFAFGGVSFFIRAYPFSLKRERGDRTQRFAVFLSVLPVFGLILFFQRVLYRNPAICVAVHLLILFLFWLLEAIAEKRLNRILIHSLDGV